MICIIDCSCSSQEWSVRMVIGSCDLVIFIIKTISKSYNKGEFFSRRHRKKTKSKKKQKKQIFYFFLSQRSHLPFSWNFLLLFLPSSGFLWKCCGLKQQNDLQTLRHFNVKRRKKDRVVAVVAGNIKLEFVFLFLWNFLFLPSVLGTTAFDRDAPEAVDCVYDRHWKHLHRRHKKKKKGNWTAALLRETVGLVHLPNI